MRSNGNKRGYSHRVVIQGSLESNLTERDIGLCTSLESLLENRPTALTESRVQS